MSRAAIGWTILGVVVGLPFAVLLVLMMIGLYMGLGPLWFAAFLGGVALVAGLIILAIKLIEGGGR